VEAEIAQAIRRARLFAGYAGWGPGQLEAELDEDSWIVEQASAQDVFTEDPEALWSSVVRRKGREYAMLALMPVDPRMN
jgi:putative transcriptional regulator